MNIVLNGKEYETACDTSIAHLLQMEGYAGKRIAVEINEEIVPRSEYDRHRLRDGDCVEIVRAIGGG